MAKDSITLSPKHGVNPTLPICFFCGNERGDIALLGKLPDDKEAPKYIILDYEPCDSCRSHMEQGITCIEVTDKITFNGQPTIDNTHYPTGRWCVITEEAAQRIFTDKNLVKGKTILIDVKIAENLFNPISDN